MTQTRSPRQRSAFGQRMRESREAAGLVQEDVCRLVGISQSALAGLEGTAAGSSFTVQLAQLYKVDPYWLATGEGERDAIVLTDDERLLIQTLRQRAPNVVSLPPAPPPPSSRPGLRLTALQKRRTPAKTRKE